eukprot:scaffold1406_cov115-Isochrysis_galbana.AAC.5
MAPIEISRSNVRRLRSCNRVAEMQNVTEMMMNHEIVLASLAQCTVHHMHTQSYTTTRASAEIWCVAALSPLGGCVRRVRGAKESNER